MGFSQVAGSGRPLSSCGARLLIAVASLVAEHRLSDSWVSVVAAPKLSYSVACRIFQTQGLNPRLLHCRLAQSVEHETLNLRVVGSSPTLGGLIFCFSYLPSVLLNLLLFAAN